MAVYAFPHIDLESELVLLYGFEESAAWSLTLPRIQTERSRARARAGMWWEEAAGEWRQET